MLSVSVTSGICVFAKPCLINRMRHRIHWSVAEVASYCRDLLSLVVVSWSGDVSGRYVLQVHDAAGAFSTIRSLQPRGRPRGEHVGGKQGCGLEREYLVHPVVMRDCDWCREL